MMELLPLPNFHHLPMAVALFILLVLVVWFIFGKKRGVKIDFNDPYALTRALRQKKPGIERDALLKELEKYKYSPNPPKLPKLLKKRIKKVLQ